MEELVLDLRGNGGGLLHESVNIVNFFVEKGEDVAEVRGKVKEHYQNEQSAERAPRLRDSIGGP